MLNIEIVSCLNDNFSYIIHEDNTGIVGVIDPSEFYPIDELISKKYKKIDFILNTHHHFDHVGGNKKIKEKYKSKVVGSKIDKNRIPEIDILLSDNDSFKFGTLIFKIMFAPGHTSGHICFYCEEEKIIFTGDTLFSLGCGRIFEGSYKQMFNSLNIIKKLPKETNIYCGHEYTKKNLEFCLKYDKNNEGLNIKKIWIEKRLQDRLPSIPVSLGSELSNNIFFRCDDLSVKKNLGMQNSSEEEIFKKLRDLKDSF
jgi:hydroxyacylglutathione hydrolase